MPTFSPPSVAAPDFLALAYRPDLHLLVGRWQRPVTEAEFRQGYRATLALAQAVGCSYWQLDLRGRNPAELEAQRWLTEKFLPELPGQLPTPVYLAYLASPQQLRQLVPVAAEAYQVAFFSEEGPLTHWLTSCQHRSREALAQAGFTPPPAAQP